MEHQVTIKNDLGLFIRKAEEDDAEAMIEFMQQVTHESDNLARGPGEFNYTVDQEKQFIRNAHASTNNVFVLGIIGDEICSIANVSSSSLSRMKHVGEIGVSVAKKYWNHGVGTAIMEFIIDWSKDAGLRKLNLSVRSDHQAGIALYEKVGFVKEGVQQRALLINGEFVSTDEMGLLLD